VTGVQTCALPIWLKTDAEGSPEAAATGAAGESGA